MRTFNGARVWAKGALSLALLLGTLAIPSAMHASGAPAPTPTEVTVMPPGVVTSSAVDAIQDVGASGYLHHVGSSPDAVWTRFADGSSTIIPGLTHLTPLVTGERPAGGDWIFQGTTGTVTLTNLNDQSIRTLTLPDGQVAMAVNGTDVLTRTATSPQTFEILSYGGGGAAPTSITPVTGLPGGTSVCRPDPWWVTDTSATIVYCTISGTPNITFTALIDMTTATALELTSPLSSLWAMDHDFLVGLNTTTPESFMIYSRADLAGGAVTPTAVPVPTDLVGTGPRFAIVGNHILAVNQSTGASYDIPLDGGTPTSLYPSLSGLYGLMGGPNGDAVLVSQSTKSDRGTHHITAGPNGSLINSVVRTDGPSLNAGISMGYGIVHHVESSTNPVGAVTYKSFDQALTLYPDDNPALINGVGDINNPTPTCQPDVACLNLVTGSGIGTIYLSAGNVFGSEYPGTGTKYTAGVRWSSDARIVDVSEALVVVDSGSEQYVIVPGTSEKPRVSPPSAVALSGSAVWRPTQTARPSATHLGSGARPAPTGGDATPAFVAGSITSTDYRNGSQRTVLIPSGCVPSELQAETVWIYWSCGASGPAGAHNLTTGANVALPAGHTLLGDGYAVIQDHQDLKLYAFSTGTVADPVTIGSVPAGPVTDARQYSWTVDKNGGDIAYVDADDSVHVIDPGVTPTPVAISGASIAAGQPLYVNAAFDRPVDSWTISVKSALTGMVVKTISGGPTRRVISASWDHTNASGLPIPSSTYDFGITATAGGVTGTPHQLSLIICGTPVFRSYDCTGEPEFLAVAPDSATGEGHWFAESSTGSLVDHGNDGYWPTDSTTALIPWGDFNGDGTNDLLYRDANGTLRWSEGGNQGTIGGDAYSGTTIGTGWQIYNLLLTTGDFNGDGVFDMIARDKSGNLYMYPGRASGRFGSRVKIGTGWSGFTRIVGIGDITGDGNPDLVAQDAHGVLWRYSGNGSGGFSGKAEIGSGWGGYTAIVGIGDFDHDGHNDLIARDTAGVLWLFTGTGTGAFNARIKISTAFAGYPRIY